jgi:tricorn protease
MPLSD